MFNTQPIDLRPLHIAEQPSARLKSFVGIFSIQTYLNCVAVRLITARKNAWVEIASGKTHHPLNQINAKHLFGHAMFHLQSGIHLKEIKGLALLIKHKLHSTRIAIVNFLSQRNGRGVQVDARLLIQIWRRRLFDDFLITALRRAIALP